MDRGSDLHNPRLDDEMAREVGSLTRGAPLEARAEPERMMEGAVDGEPEPEPVVDLVEASPPPGTLPHADVRARSELARHLRPSLFPAERQELLDCAIEEHAPADILEALARIPDTVQYANVQQVWEAMGGEREARIAVPEPAPEEPTSREPLRSPTERFDFRFDRLYQLAAMPFGITPGRAYVELDFERGRLVVHYGQWSIATPLTNIAAASITGPYSLPKTIGPAHLSFADQGLTFASNRDRGVCIQFREPIRGIEPLGVLRHPAVTVTVAEPEALRDALHAELF